MLGGLVCCLAASAHMQVMPAPPNPKEYYPFAMSHLGELFLVAHEGSIYSIDLRDAKFE
jgi:hypothetical protein